jgi:hypothetical protein
MTDWRYDLNDKLTFELRKAMAPVYPTLLTHQTFANHCRQVDQEHRRIKEDTERIKNRQNATNIRATPTAKPTDKVPTSIPKTTSTNTSTYPTKPRPTYDNPERQALSRAGACFTCHQQGHLAKNCPMNAENKVIEGKEGDEDAGKAEP